jgi:hypothetical protein
MATQDSQVMMSSTPPGPNALPNRLSRNKKKINIILDDEEPSQACGEDTIFINSQKHFLPQFVDKGPIPKKQKRDVVSIFDEPEEAHKGGLTGVYTDNPGAKKGEKGYIEPQRRLSALQYQNSSFPTSYAPPSESHENTVFYSRVAHTWKLSRSATVRTGYMDGELTLRISSCGELSEKRTPFRPDQVSEELVMGLVMCHLVVAR